MRTTILCLAFALAPSMTHAQASTGVPVIKVVKEESSIKFNVKASVALEGTFDKWDAKITMTSADVESGVLDIKIKQRV
jgi:polyisoprenoid-binding protein YceI